MTQLPLPFEVRAAFRVPRQQAEKVVSKFKTGISFLGLLPAVLKSSDAGIHPNPPDGPEAAIWVVFKPRHASNRVTQRSLARSDGTAFKPAAESPYADLIGSQRGTDDLV
jgi:hypothetical protein